MEILLLAGTNRRNAKTNIVMEHYQQRLSLLDIKAVTCHLAELPADFTHTALYEHNGKNDQFNLLRNKVLEHHKFIFIVPEYNASYPGVLKSFIDGLKYPDSFLHKKAALTGVSSGPGGGALALSHLTDVLHYMGMQVLASKVRLMHVEKSIQDGRLYNPFYTELIDAQIKELAAF